MLGRLTLLFAVVTGLELAILVPLSGAVGILPTIGIILLSAVVGAKLASQQGSRVWNNIQEELRNGEMPADSLLDGLAVLIAGAFLLTPGVLTDVAGILLLIPPCRVPIKSYIRSKFEDWREEGHVTFVQPGSMRGGAAPGFEDPNEIFEGREVESPDVDGPDVDASEPEVEPTFENRTEQPPARMDRAEVIDIQPSDSEDDTDDDGQPESLDPVGDTSNQ